MVRNSADHGLETPDERLAAGKGEQGTIRLSAYHEGGHIIICIADNGRGAQHRADQGPRPLANGLVSEAELEKMSEAQIHKFIFAPGFSNRLPPSPRSPAAASAWTWVRTNIDQIGGTIDVKSVSGEGYLRHRQDPAHPGHRFGPDRRSRRRPLCDSPIVCRGSWSGPRANSETPHRAHQGHGRLAAAQQAVAADAPQEALEDRRRFLQRSRERLLSWLPRSAARPFGIVVDAVFHTERDCGQADVDPKLRHIEMFSGNTIFGRWRWLS